MSCGWSLQKPFHLIGQLRENFCFSSLSFLEVRENKVYKWYFIYVIFSIKKAIVFSNILRSKCFLQYFLVALTDLVNSVIISNNPTQMVNFPTRIPDCDYHSFVLLDLFLSSDASICSTIAFPLLGNSDQDVVSVWIDFLSNSQQDALFHRIAYDYSHADGDSFGIIWEMFHGRILLNLGLLLLLVNFVSGFRLELMYISLIISIRSSLTHLHDFQLLLQLS